MSWRGKRTSGKLITKWKCRDEKEGVSKREMGERAVNDEEEKMDREAKG